MDAKPTTETKLSDTTAINRIQTILDKLTPSAATRVLHFIMDANAERRNAAYAKVLEGSPLPTAEQGFIGN
jgi:hypothetical protein